jgi:transitional endoplasmic reticulum ATPase
VFIIAATNRPDMLDSAVMRPGRLDQLVYLPLPDLECRRAIFGAATRKSPLAADISLDDFAARTEGYSGADITELCQRACKLAIRQHIADASAGAPEDQRCTIISSAHFEEAFSKARKSVTAADVKKFETFQASMRAR